MSIAVITGGSRGLGRALASGLAQRDWRVVTDARQEATLLDAFPPGGTVDTLAGDVTDAAHRAALIEQAASHGSIDLIVNNASYLGPSPLQGLAELEIAYLRRVFEVNVVAPVALVQSALPRVSSGGIIINVSSDAAVEAYPGWGGYGASKAALDHVSAILARERPDLLVYSFDPGDMRTAMHQAAFPGENISDRPEPETVVPALLALIESRPPSGRYTAGAFAVGAS